MKRAFAPASRSPRDTPPLYRLEISLSLTDRSLPLNRGRSKVCGRHWTNQTNRNDWTTWSFASSGPNGALASEVRENGAPLDWKPSASDVGASADRMEPHESPMVCQRAIRDPEARTTRGVSGHVKTKHGREGATGMHWARSGPMCLCGKRSDNAQHGDDTRGQRRRRMSQTVSARTHPETHGTSSFDSSSRPDRDQPSRVTPQLDRIGLFGSCETMATPR
jgi:hypothetical protein